MNIIYLHGFNSDGNGSTAVKLKSHYRDNIITPSYDYQNADNGYNQLNSIVQKGMNGDNLVLVGTSLGGFWANYFSEKYDIKCILINPALHPEISLQKYIGENKNFSNNKMVKFTKEDAERYSAYDVGESSNVFKTVLLGAKDEVIDYRNTEKHFKGHNMIIDQDEEHRIKDVSKIINLIDDIANTFAEQQTDVPVNPLNEHVINAPSNDMQTKQKYADEVWDILQNSYKKIGGLKGSGFSSKEDMINSIPFWKMIKKDGRIVAVRMYKDKLGRKSVAAGTDGSREGINAFKMMSDEDLKKDRSYTEISGPVLAFVVKNNKNIKEKCIPYNQVERLVGEEIRRPQSTDLEMIKYPELRDFFYQRFIGKQFYTKIMIGKTDVKMY